MKTPVAGLLLLAAGASLALADAKVDERAKFELAGTAGKIVNMFGGKAAREGLTTQRALVGERRMSRTGENGELVDLAAEKVYRIDFDRRTYTVQTFEEIRRELREQMDRAKEEQREAEEEAKDKPAGEKPPEYEVDVDVRESGKKDKIAGYDAREVLVTVTVREKGKTLEQAGGGILNANLWLGPRIKPVDELNDFERRFAEKLYGDLMPTAQQSAAIVAAYPALGKAMKTFQDKRVDMDGTPLRTVMALEVVAPPGEAGGEQAESEKSAGIGGMLGRLGKKFGSKKADEQKEQQVQKEGTAPPGGKGAGTAIRRSVFTSTVDVLTIAGQASAAEVAIPEGFKQKS